MRKYLRIKDWQLKDSTIVKVLTTLTLLVARLATIRSILSQVASENMILMQFDVSTAFLYKENICMKIPEGCDNTTD